MLVWPIPLWVTIKNRSSKIKLKAGRSEYKRLFNQLLDKSEADYYAEKNDNLHNFLLLFIRTICAFNLGDDKKTESEGGDYEEDIFRFELGCLLILILNRTKTDKTILKNRLVEILRKTYIQKSSFCLSKPIGEIEAIVNDRIEFYERKFAEGSVDANYLISIATEAGSCSIKHGGKLLMFKDFSKAINLDMNTLLYAVDVQLWFVNSVPHCIDGFSSIIKESIENTYGP
jgi:hypothetical protein